MTAADPTTTGRWAYYTLATGLFTGAGIVGPLGMALSNAPPGCGVAPHPAGDIRLHRVINAAGDTEPHTPPLPPDSPGLTWRRGPDGAPQSAPTPAALAEQVRAERNRRADAYNGVVARAYRLGEPISAAVATYLQALADVPQQPGFPTTVTWPEEPAV